MSKLSPGCVTGIVLALGIAGFGAVSAIKDDNNYREEENILSAARSGGCHKLSNSVVGMNQRGWDGCMANYNSCTYSISHTSDTQVTVSFFLNGVPYDTEALTKDNIGMWQCVSGS